MEVQHDAAGLADLDSPIALAFLRRSPTPDSAARFGPKRLAGFLASHAQCGRRSPAARFARRRAAPTGRAGEAEAEARGEPVRGVAAILETLVVEIVRLSGRICAAAILAELGDVRERFPTADQRSAEAGVAPVSNASGTSRGVTFRWARNHRLRQAITTFADTSRHASAWAARLHHPVRRRGCKHQHATRIPARAWCRVLWKARQDRTAHDPARHAAAAKRAA